MKVEMFPKQYMIRLEDWNVYDEGTNLLELSEEQFKELLFAMCNIADDEDFLVKIINEVNSAKNQVQKRNRTVIPFIG